MRLNKLAFLTDLISRRKIWQTVAGLYFAFSHSNATSEDTVAKRKRKKKKNKTKDVSDTLPSVTAPPTIPPPDSPPPPPCVPNCQSDGCGDDGCGGNCGICAETIQCCNGVCKVSCLEHTIELSFYAESFAFHDDGSLLVGDTTNGRVVHVDAEGNELSTIGRLGTDPGEFNLPFGIAIDADGNVYIADYGNSRVQKFDQAETLVGVWPDSSDGNTKIRIPLGIAVNPANVVYIGDDGVLRFTADGEFLSGLHGGPHPLPAQLAFDAIGNLFVVDQYEHRVLIYDSNDNFVKSIGELGDGPGEFNYPFGVVVDRMGRVHVSDSRQRIQVFDVEGNYLFEWMRDRFSSPHWLGIDSEGRIVVRGSWPKGLQAFRIGGPLQLP